MTNEELHELHGFNSRYIRMVFGVQERVFLGEGERFSDLAVTAGRRALENAGVLADDIDLLITSCCSSDNLLPKAGTVVQRALGLSRAQVVNINAACSGPNFGMGLAWRYIANGRCTRVLVVMGDTLSVSSSEDDIMRAAFSDAASAAVVEAVLDPEVGFMADSYGCDGTLHEAMVLRSPGSRFPMNEQRFSEEYHRTLNQPELMSDVMPLTAKWCRDCWDDCLAKAEWTSADVDFVSPHPVSLIQMRAQMEALGLGMDRTLIVTDELGHSGSGTSFIVLERAVEQGIIDAGSRVYCFTVGSGFIWGGMLMTWSPAEAFS